MKNGGTCRYSLTGTRRTKPLADLFEPSAGTPAVGAEGKKEKGPEKQEKQNRKDRQMPLQSIRVPQVCGTMEEKGRRLILLSNGQKSQACAAGDSFDSWQIVYISPGVAGLSKEGVIHEVYF